MTEYDYAARVADIIFALSYRLNILKVLFYDLINTKVLTHTCNSLYILHKTACTNSIFCYQLNKEYTRITLD